MQYDTKFSHTHIAQGDTPGCPACAKAEGRTLLAAPPEVERSVYRPLTADEFNAGTCYTYYGVPIVEDEYGAYVYAYGHIDKALYAAVVNRYDSKMGGSDPENPYTSNHVEHPWAVNLTDPDKTDDWYISWAAEYQEHEQRFPVTVVSR